MLQEDGYGRIVGRIKDCIIRIGDKIFAGELEDFFTKHPNIIEAQVCLKTSKICEKYILSSLL